jgi:hypothetical protein
MLDASVHSYTVVVHQQCIMAIVVVLKILRRQRSSVLRDLLGKLSFGGGATTGPRGRHSVGFATGTR